jgi:hypothetical protein
MSVRGSGSANRVESMKPKVKDPEAKKRDAKKSKLNKKQNLGTK